MKCLKLTGLIFYSILTFSAYSQSVGVGTNVPNSSAVLDVSSSNKGLLLPRVNDTGNVANPAAGLVIYNRTDRAPNYFDGQKWNNVADARNNFVQLNGSIKYTIIGTTNIGGIAVDNGALDAIDYGNGFTTPIVGGLPSGHVAGMDTIMMIKEFDGNSIIFILAQLSSSVLSSIEIKHFLPGANTPFYSIKLTNVLIARQTNFISEKSGKLTEQYRLICNVIGFKDWISGKSFSYNKSTYAIGTY